MKTIYKWVKAEYTENRYLRKAQRICQKLGYGEVFIGKPGKYITEKEWSEVKKYLEVDNRKHKS